MSKQQPEILFQLTNIEQVGTELLLSKNFVIPEVYEYDVAMECSLSPENELIKLKLEIQVKAGRIKCGSLTLVFSYSVANYNEIIIKNKSGKYVLPDNLQESVNSISISTARGILFSTFRGTALHRAILPVIDSKQFQSKISNA